MDGHPQVQRSISTHMAMEHTHNIDPTLETRKRDAKTRLLVLKTLFAALHIVNVAGSKPLFHSRSINAMKAALLLQMKALHTLEGLEVCRLKLNKK